MSQSPTLAWQLTLLRWGLRGLSAVSPRGAAQVGLALFTRPRRHRRPSREQGWLDAAERFEIRLDEERLAAWSWGEGPPVLLIHGWEGRGSQMGAFVEPLVEAGHRVVTFDAPGHGDSTGSRSSLPHMARAVEAMAARIGRLAGVIAHSAGAPVLGHRLARGLDAPRVVLISPGVYPVRYVWEFGRLLGLRTPAIRRMEQLLQSRYGVHPLDFGADRWAPEGRAPLLAVTDEDDDEIPVSDVEALVGLWPEARLHVTSGLGHRRILRDPDVVSEVVGFLASEIPVVICQDL